MECRLPDGSGGVGKRRQCISDSGVINQRITRWEVSSRLQFQMEDTTLYFRPCVNSIIEEFTLTLHGTSKTKIIRATTFNVTGAASWLKGMGMCIGMKFVHRYVFKNWARTAT